ncbi:PH domain-containing protein [Glaciecola sp. 1036]|uniref:PH domain-containing protein n=1 Tax=Alteromonadaceae TaxID=72275 RepID=UPI003D002C4A
MSERILQQASFNPKVKTYWLINWIIISSITLFGIPLLIISIPLVLFFCSRSLKAMSATLLERKLVVKRGIFFKVEKSIPLEKITDVAMSQGPIMRIFDLYALSFETAGQSGPGALVSLTGINGAAEFREAILQQKDNMTISPKAKQYSEASVEDGTSDLAELKDSVKRIEAMLAEMLAAKKN